MRSTKGADSRRSIDEEWEEANEIAGGFARNNQRTLASDRARIQAQRDAARAERERKQSWLRNWKEYAHRRQAPPEVRMIIAERQGYLCRMPFGRRRCPLNRPQPPLRFPKDPRDGARIFELDHIVPFARGGPTKPDNLQALCLHCHQLKTRGEQMGMMQRVPTTRK